MAFQKRRSDEELLGDLNNDLLILREQGSLNGTSDACRARICDARTRPQFDLTPYAELVAHLESPPVVTPEAPTPAAAEALLVTVVGLRSKKQDNGRQRVSIQRGTPLGNPFPVKEDGKTLRTAGEATALFRPWLAEQLADPTSPQSLKVAELRQLLGQGQRLELGCCGHADCHGHAIAEHLTALPVVPSQIDPAPDREQVRRYFELLQKDQNTARIRGIPHKKLPDKKEIGTRAGVFNFADIKRWQQAKRRVYCVVNNGGDDLASITSCVANYFEFDSVTVEQQRQRLAEHPEIGGMVGMVVATREQTSASLHCYLLLQQPETDVWWWRLQQWRLIRLFKSDDRIEDPSRVMALPGTHYIGGESTSLGRAHIVDDLTNGRRVTVAQIDAALTAIEQRQGLTLWEAIPASQRNKPEVLEMLQARHPEVVPLSTEVRHTTSIAEGISHLQLQQKPWHRARTLDEIKEALAMMPPRQSGLNTYDDDRKVLCGLATALEEVELPRGNAVTLLEEAGWTGWEPSQVLNTSYEMASDTFWAHARKCGWKPKEEKVAEEERLRRQATQQEFRSDLLDLHSQNLTASELTAALMNLAIHHKQQYISVRKAYDELLENERGIERLTEVLDLITTAKQEDHITVRELASERFCSEVIDDFRQRFEADELMVLMLVLTTMSSVLPIGCKVRLLDYTLHDQAALLYVVVVTPSGGKKTMIYNQLVEVPLMASGVKERADKTYRRVKAQQTAAYAKKKGKGAESESEPAPQPDPTSEPSSTTVEIQPLRHVVGSFTGEGIDRNCQQAAQHYGHGYLIGTDEGRVLMSGDQYKGGNSTHTIDKLTELYDGKGSNQVRGNSNNERNYDKSHVAIAVLLQPEIYEKISAEAADDESGFWPRFLTLECGPIQTKRLSKEERQALHAPTYPASLQRIYDYANQLGRYVSSDTLGQVPHFRFSAEAQDWWVDRHYEIEERQLHEANNGDPMVGRYLGKAAGQVGRLAVLLHILDKAITGDLADTPSVEIPLETVQKAYRLQARLLSRTIRQRLRVHNGGATDDAALLRDVQQRCLEKDPNGKGLKLGAIERFWNQRNRPTKEDLYQAVTALAAGGFGEVSRSGNNRGGFIYKATTPLPA